MKQKYFGKRRRYTCWAFAFSLYLFDKRCTGVMIRWNGWFPHFLAITEDYVVHFTSKGTRTSSPYFPFVGQNHIFHKKLLRNQKYWILRKWTNLKC